MSTHKRICSRRPMSGVAVMGFFACSVTLYGAPPSDRGLPDPTVRSALTMVDLDALETEEMPPGPAVEILNHEAIERGVVATGGTVEKLVYQQAKTCGCGFFFKGDDTRGFGSYGNQMILGGGFEPGDSITGYSAFGFCSSLSPTPCTVQIELWDGDTLGLVDTACITNPQKLCGDRTTVCATDADCAGIEFGICTVRAQPIAGTKTTFTIPRASAATLRAFLKEKVVIDCDRVWMVLTITDGCRFAWLSGGAAPACGGCGTQPAQIGFSDWIELFFSCETFGECNSPSGYLAGKCCDTDDPNAAFCDHTNAPPFPAFLDWCADNPDICCGIHPTQCTDNAGIVDAALQRPTDPPGGQNFVASIFAPADLTITLQPKSAHGKPKQPEVPSEIIGNEIKLSKGGVNIQMEIQISDWSDPPDKRLLKAFGARMDSAGFTSALKGTIEEKLVECEALCDGGLRNGLGCLGNPDCIEAACDDSGDPCSGPDSCDVANNEGCSGGTCKATEAGQATCFNSYGGICSFSAGPCSTTPDCPFSDPPFLETCDPVNKCLDGEQRLAGFCAPSYIVLTRKDFALLNGEPLCGVDLGSPNYSPSCAVTGAAENFADLETTAKGAYAGTIWVHVPENAAGTFTLNLIDSGLIDGDSFSILGIGLVPAKITIQVGKCCAGIGGNDNKHVCIDQLTENQCQTVGVCKGFCELDPGIQCADDAECEKNGVPPPCIGGATLGNVCLNDQADAVKKGLDCDVAGDEKCVKQGISIWSPKEQCSGVFENDCPSCLEDIDCADGDACTVDVCNPDGTCSNTKVAIGDDECCQDNTISGSADDLGGGGAIVSNDDGNECTTDTCDKGGNRGVPVHTSRDGESCDDGDTCTFDDTCDAEDKCNGTSIVGVGCNENAECEALVPDCTQVVCDTDNKVCITELPELTLEIDPSNNDVVAGSGFNPKCFAQGQKINVSVVFLNFPAVVQGAQFIVTYDPSCVQFVSIGPGGAPYVFELANRVDQATGRIFYAVGVDPFGGKGVAGSGVLARLSFIKLAGQSDCPNCIFCLDGQHPQNIIVADQNGSPFPNVTTACSNEIHVDDRLSLNVPRPNEGVNSLCDERGAVVTWDPPTASSSCADPHGCDPLKKKCYEVNLVCQGSGTLGPYSQSVVMNGGLLDQGRSTFCCTATSKICGDSVNDCWTVDVNDQVSIDITVQLQPIMAATTLTRCIEFQLYENCTEQPMCFRQDLVFGGSNFIGKFEGKKKVRKAQWACMTARDQSHSLESCTFLDCRADGNFEAVFAGDPFFGGNWLIQGNLDGWNKLPFPLASPDTIDILDFATYITQFGQQLDPNTPCDGGSCVDPLSAGSHADINGDGVVDGTDFAFIFGNFLAANKNCCCPDATAGAPGRTEVSVRELREMGLDDLIVADLNRDGLVNMADMNEFLAGKRPDVKGTSRTRTGSGIGSRR